MTLEARVLSPEIVHYAPACPDNETIVPRLLHCP